MSRPDSAFLFSAGLGTRMAPLTDSLPKPLIRVGGRPLFDHALHLIRGAGIGRIAANTHYLADRMSRHLSRAGVLESHEPRLLDTGGGLKAALPVLSPGDAVITLNTDAVWTGANPLPALLDAWDPAAMDALLLLVPRDRAVGHAGRGDFVTDADGRLSPGPGDIYSGLQIISTAPFRDSEHDVFGMYSVWSRLMSRGRMYGQIHDGGWCDVGRPDCLPLAEAMLETAGV